MYEALRKGADVDASLREEPISNHGLFEQMKELVELEEEILKYKGKNLPDELLIQAKKMALPTDIWLKFWKSGREIRKRRIALGVVEAWEPVPVSGVENAAYYYSTYNAPDKVQVSKRKEDHGTGRRPQPHRPGHRV